MFRGKESSNRIELSQLVQDLLNFAVLSSLRLWGGAGGWVVSGGIWGHGGVPRCTCTHAHAHVYMYRNCKWPLTWRHPCLVCLTCMCMCACMHACVHVCVCMCACMGHPPHTHPHPIHPSTTPTRGTPGIS